MKFRFDENMYGHFREIRPDGASGTFDFTCRAEADMVRFIQDRNMRLTGTVTMEGIAKDAPMEGTLRIDPLSGKELVYDFTFAHDGSRYRFLGRKSVRFMAPVTSMTNLSGQVERDGVTLADVDSRFNLLELPGFLLSFRLGL
ncbi:MAG: hypothetical protein GXP54_03840 [Deltaproteobacteria bacterium]|nr:hypothetical protein [Deltaproteobacteria bacterium]